MYKDLEKKKLYQKKWDMENKEKRKQYNKEKNHKWYIKNKEKVKQYDKEYRYKNHSHILNNLRQYYWKNHDKLRAENKIRRASPKYKKIQKEYSQNHKKRINETRRERYSINKEKYIQYNKEYRIKTKKKIIEKFGGKCRKCNVDNWKFLQVNHINGGGTKELKIIHPAAFYHRILNGKRKIDDLKLLCANCNVIYEYEMGRRGKLISYINLKNNIISFFGNKCKRCGTDDWRILQINHINGNGGKEVDKKSVSQFYRDILNEKRTSEDLELLCANCNILYEYEVGRRGIKRN